MFKPVSEQIDDIYKALTVSTQHPTGGQAYLNTDNHDEPYLDGVK